MELPSVVNDKQRQLLLSRLEGVDGDITHSDFSLESIHVDCDPVEVAETITEEMRLGIMEDWKEGFICRIHYVYACDCHRDDQGPGDDGAWDERPLEMV